MTLFYFYKLNLTLTAKHVIDVSFLTFVNKHCHHVIFQMCMNSRPETRTLRFRWFQSCISEQLLPSQFQLQSLYYEPETGGCCELKTSKRVKREPF